MTVDWILAAAVMMIVVGSSVVAYAIGYDRGWDQHETREDIDDPA